ncbi:uncharacterized protein TNCV_2380631 [Trichonephila clavipes]|nr:uncharacterized protein TNCV_2380631 [Trichonephila clavipes]
MDVPRISSWHKILHLAWACYRTLNDRKQFATSDKSGERSMAVTDVYGTPIDREDRLTVKSTVTAPDSSLSTIKRATHTADPAFTTACHTGPQPRVIVEVPILLTAGHLWSSLEASLQPNEDKTRPHAASVSMNCLTTCQTLPYPAKSLFNRACLGYDGKATVSTRGMLMILPNDWSKVGKKYRRRPSGCFIPLCHVVWQLASRLEMGQYLIELVICNNVTLK